MKSIYKLLSTLTIAAIISNTAFINVTYAANPYNISKLRIDELTIPTSSSQQDVLLKDNATFSKLNVTIKPLALGKSDGKGFEFTDGTGELFAFDIADDHQMQIYHKGVVAYNDSTKIVANVEYDFIVYVKPTGIEVWHSKLSTTTKILEYKYALKPPFRFYLFAQRTGATFRNVIIKEQ